MKKNKYIMTIFIILILFIPIVSFSSDIKVYITRTGKKYHRATCSYLRQSKIEIDLEDAVSSFSPCSRCNPPTLDDVEPENNKTEIKNEIPTTQKHYTETPSTTKTTTTTTKVVNTNQKEDSTPILPYIGILVFFSPFIIGFWEFMKSIVSGKKDTHETKGVENTSTTTNTYQKNTYNSYNYICPKCGSKLQIKNGKYGKFIGCTNFPYCRYTKSIKHK